jgi:hypothetical protein
MVTHLGGKIHTRSKVPLRTRHELSLAYTPGVARVSRAIVRAMAGLASCPPRAVAADVQAVPDFRGVGDFLTANMAYGKSMGESHSEKAGCPFEDTRALSLLSGLFRGDHGLRTGRRSPMEWWLLQAVSGETWRSKACV